MKEELRVGDVMTRTPCCLPASQSLSEAYSWLLGEGVRGAPVVDEGGRLVGVVSSPDLIVALKPVLGPGKVDPEILAEVRERTLGELVRRTPVTCPPSMPLDEACRLMLERRVRRLVVCEGEEVTGILSATDVVYAFATHGGPASA